MTSTSGTVRVISGRLQPGQESVVEERTVVEMVSSASERPGAAGVTAMPRRRRCVQTAAAVCRRRRCLVVAGGRGREGGQVGSTQLPDVRVAVLSAVRAAAAGAGRGDAVQLADVFVRFARWRHHQRYVGRHRHGAPRTIERSLPAAQRPRRFPITRHSRKLKFSAKAVSLRRSTRGRRACRATSLSSLPRAYLIDWSAGGLPPCIVLPVGPWVVSFSKFHWPDMHDLLRTCSRGCYEANAPVEFQR